MFPSLIDHPGPIIPLSAFVTAFEVQASWILPGGTKSGESFMEKGKYPSDGTHFFFWKAPRISEVSSSQLYV